MIALQTFVLATGELFELKLNFVVCLAAVTRTQVFQRAPFVSTAGDMFSKMNKGGKNWGSSGSSKGQGYVTSKGMLAPSKGKGGSGWDAHKGSSGWDANISHGPSWEGPAWQGKGQGMWEPPSWETGTYGTSGDAQTREYVPRLQGRYAFSKALLRPYAGDSGSFVYAPTIDPESAFGKNHLRQVLDSKNSELVRRPALGISMIAHSVLAFADALKQEEKTRKSQAAVDKIAKLLAGKEGKKFLAACKTLLPESAAKLEVKNLKEPVGEWLDFFRANKESFAEMLPILGAHAATLYVGACQAAEATTMSNALANWVAKIPETTQNQEMLSSWQEAPKNRKAAVRFLAQSLAKHHQSQKEWGAACGPLGGDSDEDDFLGHMAKRKRHDMANQSDDSDDRIPKSTRGAPKAEEELLSVSESDNEPTPEPYASRNQAEAEHFVAEVDAALKSLDGPKSLKITHEGLVNLIGTVPEAP